MKDTLDHLLEHYKAIMSMSTNDIGYTKPIETGIVTDPNFSPIASKPYTLSLNIINGF